MAGNESNATSYISVNLLSFLQDLSGSTQPQSDDAVAIDQAGSTDQADSQSNTVVFGNAVATLGEIITMDISVTSTTNPVTNIPLDPNILWGAAATAMLGATLTQWQKEREEEARREAEEAAAHQDIAARRKAMQPQKVVPHITAEDRKVALIDAQDEIARQKELAQKNAATHMNAEEHKIALLDAKDEISHQIQLAEQKAKQQLAAQAVLDQRMGEHDTTSIPAVAKVSGSAKLDSPILPPAKTSWLSNIPFVGSQLDTAWQNSGLKQFVDEKVYEPIIKPAVQVATPINIATALLTIALGYNSAQWVTNAVTDPHIFDEARANMQAERAEVVAAHPDLQADVMTKTQILFSNPFEVFNAGYDATKFFANAVAGYLDAVWQENPAVRMAADVLKGVGDQCANVYSEAWARRCSAEYYFFSSVFENPADTIVSIETSLIANPTAGAIKTAAYIYENMNIYQLSEDIAHNGLSETIQDRKNDILGLIHDDPAVQAFGILALFTLATLTGFAIPAMIVGGSMVLYQTASLLSQIDAALQAAPTRANAMNIVTDPKIRRQIATTIVLLGLVIFGGAYEVKEFNAFQDALPPSTRTAFSDLSYLKQARVFETAARLGISPDAMEFYLAEMTKLDQLSLTNALSFSDLSVRAGAADFIHTYLDRFGSDPAAVDFLKDTPFNALEYLGNEYRNPASPVQNVSMPEQVNLAQEGFKLGWDGNRLNSYADTYYNQYPPEVQAILQKLPTSDRMQLVDAGLELRSQNSSGPWQYSLEKLIQGEADEGPLPKNDVKNFAANQYNVIVTKEPVVLYRLGYDKSG